MGDGFPALYLLWMEFEEEAMSGKYPDDYHWKSKGPVDIWDKVAEQKAWSRTNANGARHIDG